MKNILTIALLSVLSQQLFAFGVKEAKISQANELAQCGAFYSLAAAGMREQGDLEMSDDLRELGNIALQLSSSLGNARVAHVQAIAAMDDQRTYMDGNLGNYSSLMKAHLNTCLSAVDQPDERFDYWLGKDQ